MTTLIDIAPNSRRTDPRMSQPRTGTTGFCIPVISASYPNSSTIDRVSESVTDSVSASSSQSQVTEYLSSGRAVVVASTNHTGFVVFAAHDITTAAMAFLIEHTSGFVHVALPLSRCAELQIPPMDAFDARSSRMCVGVDAAAGTSTGISAFDRAVTARRLLDPSAHPDMFTRPGHLVPVCVDGSEILAPHSPAAIALALAQSAGQPPGAVFAELVSVVRPHEMMDNSESIAFAYEHNLPAVTLPTE